MNFLFYQNLMNKALQDQLLDQDECKAVLSQKTDLLPLLSAAFEVRKKYWGSEVAVHIINNVQNGGCSQNCSYCAQSCSSEAEINTYAMKTEEQIYAEAKDAYEAGAFRHCLVFSGKGPSKARINKLVEIVKEIKRRWPMQVCVSPGSIDQEDAKELKEAGLDRINHNLNTSENFYSQICTTHTFQDRLNTLKATQQVGMQICSGVIIGMGESHQDVIDSALTLGELGVDSIPVNFFLPIEGLALKQTQELTPEYCLRVLCLFRFLNPRSEIRAAAGREEHMRHLQALSLYVANSIFMTGYLNTQGSNIVETLRMIRDAGCTIKSGKTITEIMNSMQDNDLEASKLLAEVS